MNFDDIYEDLLCVEMLAEDASRALAIHAKFEDGGGFPASAWEASTKDLLFDIKTKARKIANFVRDYEETHSEAS